MEELEVVKEEVFEEEIFEESGEKEAGPQGGQEETREEESGKAQARGLVDEFTPDEADGARGHPGDHAADQADELIPGNR